MKYENQELLVMVDRLLPTLGRVVACQGVGATKAMRAWCGVLPKECELPAGVGPHIWCGWIEYYDTFPLMITVEPGDGEEGSWRRATAEDLERFGMPLSERVEEDVVEAVDERDGKWCWCLDDGGGELNWNHGFFPTKEDAQAVVGSRFDKHELSESEVKVRYGIARTFHPSTEFDASGVADELRSQVWQAALARLGEDADIYLVALDQEEVGMRLAEALRQELCRPEWRCEGFWVEEEAVPVTEETSVVGEEASEKELLGGL